jgi:hypothetical protein
MDTQTTRTIQPRSIQDTAVTVLDLEGNTVYPLKKSPAKATVFLFLAMDCPISNRYAPEIRAIHKKYAPKGIEFRLVYPDPGTSVAEIRKHMIEFNYPMGAYRDPELSLAKFSRVRVTPEAAVYNAAWNEVYRGRIDNCYEGFGQSRPAPTVRDLRRVLDALAAGKPLSPMSTKAVGCYIPGI